MPRKRPPNLDPINERRREVSEAERALWHEVAAMELPLLAERGEPATETEPLPPALPPKASEEQIADWLETGLLQQPEKLQTREKPAGGVDWKTARQLRQGKLEPEAVLDLHGATQAVAYEELQAFLTHSRNKGRRCVLVVTGKGRPRGILRESLPGWLRLPPCSAQVMAFTTAHIRHGGEGAFYILLRKASKHP